MIESLISEFTNTKLVSFLRSQNSSFVDYEEDLSDIVSDFEKFGNLIKLGEIEYDNTDKLMVFTCKYQGELTSRSSKKAQYEIAKKALKEDFQDGAVFVFYDQVRRFRFSFIRRNYGDKNQKFTPWKRYTYFVDPLSQTNRTFIARIGGCSFDSLEDIQLAFSVEPLSKEFFYGYKAQYKKFCDYMESNDQMKYDFRAFLTNGSNKAVRDYVKKMMGRIVFLHFLQKKGWMGVSKDSKDWTGGDQNFIENLFNSSSEEQKANFLDAVLEPLFFESLNKRRHKDWYDTKTSIGIIKIPYLNGGLYEPEKLDEPDSVFPASYFEGLFTFFNQFNFTIDENDPNDAEVGVDPEMLGHIFENLLEDNKDKGAFYTPKEVVHYMCQESLTEYLCTTLNITDIDERELINRLLKFHYVDESLLTKITDINTALDSVKICDPAIGSGAFPMGLLKEIFSIKQLLWYTEHSDLETFPASDVKLNIIQNSIYGVDIEKGAVDIARLRFWLSLVVDEDEPKALPNLDYKIACGDSLISRFELDRPINDVFSEYNKDKNQKFTLADYEEMVSDYINVHEGKELFRNKIEEIKSAFKTVLSRGDLVKRKEIEKKVLDYEAVDVFGNRTADLNMKDYTQNKKTLEDLLKAEQEIVDNKIYTNSFEWRFEFPSLLNETGDFIGFDIVIGNPPYLRIQGIRDVNPAFADALVKKYKSATGSFDMYVCFAERAFQIVKENGIVNYIMPTKWTNSAFGKGLRSLIAHNSFAYKIVNFGAYQVFEASTYTGIQWYKANSDKLLYFELDKDLESNQELGEYLNSLQDSKADIISHKKLTSSSWVLTIGETTTILNKLDKHPRRIKDIFDKIFQGLATSKDDVYFLYDCRELENTIIGYSKYLQSEIEIERGLVRPLLKGDDVHKYDHITTDKFVLFPYKLENEKARLYTEAEISVEFPLGYAYLKNCEDVLRGREKGRLMNDDFWFRYIYPKNLVLFDKEKLVAPEISLGGNFSYDPNGEFYATTKIYGYLKKQDVKECYLFWLGLFNSQLFWFYLQNTGYVLRGGYFTFKTDYINPFPVPGSISPIAESKISALVEKILLEKIIEKEADIKALEKEINNLVYRLYDLTYAEVKVIDPEIESKVSEVEYNAIEI